MLNNNIEIIRNRESIYDFQGAYTQQQLLNMFYDKIVQCLKISDESKSLLDWIKETGLPIEVQKKMEQMIVDGTFEEIINTNIFSNLNNQLTGVKQDLLTLTNNLTEEQLSQNNSIAENLKSITNLISEVEKAVEKINQNSNGIGDINNNLSLTLEPKIKVLENELTTLKNKKPSIDSDFSTSVKFVAHRGLSKVAPENSISAYKLAKQNNYEYVETDIQLNYSNDWVLMHDDTVDRTTTGTGKVSELSTEYIKSLQIDSGNNADLFTGEKVPFLDDFLMFCKNNDLKPLLEVKYCKNEQALQTLVNKIKLYGLHCDTRIISFSIETLEIVRKLDSDIKVTIVSEGDITESLITKALHIKNCDFSVSAPSGVMIKKSHENDIKVNAWTINDFSRAVELKNYGIDFITTDILKEVY